MIRRLWVRIRPAVFWDFPRGSWQYDVVVVLILAFIFLMPAGLFNDRPSQPVVQEIEHGGGDSRVFWIDPGALGRAEPERAREGLEALLETKVGSELAVDRIQPATDRAGNVQAYLVFTTPANPDGRTEGPPHGQE